MKLFEGSDILALHLKLQGGKNNQEMATNGVCSVRKRGLFDL